MVFHQHQQKDYQLQCRKHVDQLLLERDYLDPIYFDKNSLPYYHQVPFQGLLNCEYDEPFLHLQEEVRLQHFLF